MVGVVLIILVNFLGEKRDCVPNKKMRDVQRQGMIDAAFAEASVDRWVVDYRNVIVPDDVRENKSPIKLYLLLNITTNNLYVGQYAYT